jgi:putative DNA primase/helicase
MSSATFLEAAVPLARRGWPVFPLKPRDKLPLTEHGLHDATSDENQIRAWAERWPNANVGVRTEEIVAIDVDDADAFRELLAQHGAEVPRTATVSTGKGFHLLFAAPAGARIRNSAAKLAAGIDVRARGGYVVGPGSVHPSGRAYRWVDDREPAQLPEWLLELLVERKNATNGHTPAALASDHLGTTAYGRRALEEETRAVASAPEGARNDTLNRASFSIGQLVAGGEVAAGEARAALALAGANAGLRSAEIEKTIESGLAAGAQEPRNAPERLPRLEAEAKERQGARNDLRPESDESSEGRSDEKAADLVVGVGRDIPWTDSGNSERFVNEHGAELRYCAPWQRWLVWDGRHWCIDDAGEVIRRAKQTARKMLVDALERDDKGYRSHALTTEREPRLRAMVTLAQPELAVQPEQLDADPWALNVTNGVIDLRTGALTPHRRDALLTKLAPHNYDAERPAPRWDRFLNRVFAGDEELLALVQRLVGASVAGVSGVQLLPICWGTGANGKSTFLNVLQRLLGDYAHQAPSELLLHRDRSRGGATPDLADLHGRRLVAAIETGEGRRLDEALVKQLTGGDLITARRLYAHPFTFTPTHTLWLATNHLPEIRGNDLAIRRRIALLPFTVTIPDAEQRDQSELVADLLEEAAGILAWIVRGCLDWQRDGLGGASSVADATAAYLTEQDVLAAWLDECCVLDAGARVKAADLYRSYLAWSEQSREPALSQKALAPRLRDRGFTNKRTESARWWHGLRLRSDEITLDAMTDDAC